MMREVNLLAARLLAALALGAVLALGVAACGDAKKATGSTALSSSAPGSGSVPIITSSVIPPGQSLRGDGDSDNPSDIDGNGDEDGSNDGDDDNPTRASYRLPDADDRAMFAYGHPVNAAQTRTLSAIVKRYYAAGAKGDGAAACSLLGPSVASSLPEDYGGVSGPPYLRGGRSCQEIMSKLFRHFRGELGEAITVLRVRVKGAEARVLFSSRKMRASAMSLRREGGSWRIQELIGQVLG
jgi:hypothetical protein